MSYQDLLEATKKHNEAAKKLSEYALLLLEKKREALDTIDRITQTHIKPLKEDIGQIDAEIMDIMTETGQHTIVGQTYSAYMSEEFSVKVLDPIKALAWAQQHPEVLKKDILKQAEINKLVKEGVVPDQLQDGIDCSNTYKKLTFRRK